MHIPQINPTRRTVTRARTVTIQQTDNGHNNRAYQSPKAQSRVTNRCSERNSSEACLATRLFIQEVLRCKPDIPA